MKIRTKVSIFGAVSVFFILTIMAITFYTTKQVAEAQSVEDLSHELQAQISEILVITYDYLYYGEERMNLQWHIKYDLLEEILASIPDNPDKKEMVDRYTKLGVLFEKIEGMKGELSAQFSEEEIQNTLLLKEKIITQIMINSQKLANHAYSLTEQIHKKRKEIQDMNTSMIIFLSFTTILLVIISSLFYVKIILGPLKKLTQGTVEIAKGNLETEIRVNTKDEVGDLARSFETMRKELKSSRESLEKKSKYEIAKSKEDALKKEKEAKELKEEAARKVAMLKRLRKKGAETEISDISKRIQQSIADVRKDVLGLKEKGLNKKKR